jgi:hypothetical protein
MLLVNRGKGGAVTALQKCELSVIDQYLKLTDDIWSELVTLCYFEKKRRDMFIVTLVFPAYHIFSYFEYWSHPHFSLSAILYTLVIFY